VAGDLVVIRGSTPEWVDALMNRRRRVLPDADRRIKFLPTLPRRDFLHLLAIANVMLAPFLFSGATQPKKRSALTHRWSLFAVNFAGRLTHGLYRQIGDTSLSVSSVDEYVALSVQACE
jgi:predicted O-linked N-acetylglucosamine transferase (SPINDLY family)